MKIHISSIIFNLLHKYLIHFTYLENSEKVFNVENEISRDFYLFFFLIFGLVQFGYFSNQLKIIIKYPLSCRNIL